MALVSCAQLGQALTDWLLLATQAQKDAMCAALGCTEDVLTAIASNDSLSINITGDGTAGSPLQASLLLDPAGDNRIQIGASGAYVAPELPPFTAAQDGMSLKVDGTSAPPVLVWSL